MRRHENIGVINSIENVKNIQVKKALQKKMEMQKKAITQKKTYNATYEVTFTHGLSRKAID